jgi:hypothetical protein
MAMCARSVRRTSNLIRQEDVLQFQILPIVHLKSTKLALLALLVSILSTINVSLQLPLLTAHKSAAQFAQSATQDISLPSMENVT